LFPAKINRIVDFRRDVARHVSTGKTLDENTSLFEIKFQGKYPAVCYCKISRIIGRGIVSVFQKTQFSNAVKLLE
jgi:hypothetical protein